MNFENPISTNESENKNEEIKNIDNSQERKEDELSESVSDECFRHMKSGEEICLALKQIGQEAVDKGLENRQKGWEDSSNVLASMRRFEYLENASDEELKEEYIKNFESQSSDFYLGKILAALDSESSKEGFFGAYHNKPVDSLSENILKIANITERLVKVAKEVKSESELEK